MGLRASWEAVRKVKAGIPRRTRSRSSREGRPWPQTGWGGALSVETPLAAIWGQRRLGWGAGAQSFLPIAEFKP